MDYLTVVTVARISIYVARSRHSGKPVVRREPVVTRTGTQPPPQRGRAQPLFLTFSSPPLK